MDCVSCKYPDSKVVESRHEDGNFIRRRRECLRCGGRFTTQERIKETTKPNDDRFPYRKPGKDFNG